MCSEKRGAGDVFLSSVVVLFNLWVPPLYHTENTKRKDTVWEILFDLTLYQGIMKTLFLDENENRVIKEREAAGQDRNQCSWNLTKHRFTHWYFSVKCLRPFCCCCLWLTSSHLYLPYGKIVAITAVIRGYMWGNGSRLQAVIYLILITIWKINKFNTIFLLHSSVI